MPTDAPPAQLATAIAALAARREVDHAVEGLTVAGIAERLGLRFYTAQSHVKSSYRKLRVGSKAAATAAALRYRRV